jgi:uncharacterized protein YmfQ (DUF2313 family)
MKQSTENTIIAAAAVAGIVIMIAEYRTFQTGVTQANQTLAAGQQSIQQGVDNLNNQATTFNQNVQSVTNPVSSFFTWLGSLFKSSSSGQPASGAGTGTQAGTGGATST